MTLLWWVAALTAGGLTGWGLTDAVVDLRDKPGFDGVLRLVVEAVAGAVAVGYCVGRARRTPPAPADDDGRGSTGERQERKGRETHGT